MPDNWQFLQAEKMLGSVSPSEVLTCWLRATTGLALTDGANSWRVGATGMNGLLRYTAQI